MDSLGAVLECSQRLGRQQPVLLDLEEGRVDEEVVGDLIERLQLVLEGGGIERGFEDID